MEVFPAFWRTTGMHKNSNIPKEVMVAVFREGHGNWIVAFLRVKL